jgi:hypothetical protein
MTPCPNCGDDRDDVRLHLCIPKWVREKQAQETVRRMYDQMGNRLTQECLDALRMGAAGTFAAPPEEAVFQWRGRAERAEAEVQRLRMQVSSYEAKIHRMVRAIEDVRVANQTMSGIIPQERLMALIRLCHPDRHAGSELANETTKWLLSLRK